MSPAQLLLLNSMLLAGTVLAVHALRRRYSLAFLYAVLGMTVTTIWITPQSLAVTIGGMNFLLGSTVLYTCVIIGVFVCYVFDGPSAGRAAIAVVVAGTILFPLASLIFRELFIKVSPFGVCPFPELAWRNYASSIIATLTDLLALTVVWGCLINYLSLIHI